MALTANEREFITEAVHDASLRCLITKAASVAEKNPNDKGAMTVLRLADYVGLI